MDKRKLKKKMIELDVTGESLISALGISNAAYWRKINGLNEFTLKEIKVISDTLRLNSDEIIEIFFA